MNKYIFSFVILGLLAVSAPVFADNGKNKHASSTVMTAADLACMRNAINARETAIQGSFSRFAASISNALVVRQKALTDAWSQTDRTVRRTAIKTAWKTYTDSLKQAHRTLRTERDNAWNTFKTTSKNNCHASKVDLDNFMDHNRKAEISI